MSGRYAVTERSKSIVMFSAVDPPTKAATTRLRSTCHTPTHGWSTKTALATLSAVSKTGGRVRPEATHTTTCYHSPCAGKRFNTKSHAAIRAETASIHEMLEDKYPSRCSPSEFHEVDNLSRALVRAFVARFSLQRVLSCLATRPHPRTASMSLEVQGHGPASPKRVFFKMVFAVVFPTRNRTWSSSLPHAMRQCVVLKDFWSSSSSRSASVSPTRPGRVSQISQLSCLPVSAFKLHRLLALSFSLLGHRVDFSCA